MQRALSWLRAIRHVSSSYVQVHGRRPRFFAPLRYTEKMQWRKLFDRNPLFSIFCDKLATRALIERRIGAQYLPALLWTGSAGEIPFDRLIPPYFLKSSHASGQVLQVTADIADDPAAITALASSWLAACYFTSSGEPGYKHVPRRLIAEQAIVTGSGTAPLERRLFVFDGKVAVINTIFIEDGALRNGAFHTPDWKRLDWYFTRFVAGDFPKPERLDEMIRIAEILGEGVDHVRVDLFDCGGRIYAGELTPYSWSGLSRFNSEAADIALGKYWQIKNPRLRALAAMLFWDR